MKLEALKILFVQITSKNSFVKENNDTYILTQALYDWLWDDEEALDEGFANYVKRRSNEIEEALQYHARNCNSYCKICSDLEKVDSNERKKPRLCA